MIVLADKSHAMHIITNRHIPVDSWLPAFNPNEGSPTRKNVAMYALEYGWTITQNMHCNTIDINDEDNDVAMTAVFWGREVEPWMLEGRNPNQMNMHHETLVNENGTWVLRIL